LILADISNHRPLSTLVEWMDNYNSNDVAIIARSIRRFGFNAALRVWHQQIVMAGNHTLKALRLIQEQGKKEEWDHAFPPANVIERDGEWYVLCVDMSHLNEIEARAFAIADNQLARQAVVDEGRMSEYLREIADAEKTMLEATGISELEMKRMINRHAAAVAALEDKGAQTSRGEALCDEWNTVSGQLWIIASITGRGEHRLLCGDSTNKDDVVRVMNSQRAVLFATDPPYLIGYNGESRPGDWSKQNRSGSHKNWDDPAQGEAFYEAFVKMAVEYAVMPDAAWYCWHASSNQAMVERVWDRFGAFVHQQIIWVKDRASLTHSWYMWQHEVCFFGWIKGKKPKRILETYPSTVWNADTVPQHIHTDHTTQKPVELFARPIEQHTERGDICYEPFAGSGTQFVAAEKSARLCYGIEKEPIYVAVILQRLADMGLLPRLVEDA